LTHKLGKAQYESNFLDEGRLDLSSSSFGITRFVDRRVSPFKNLEVRHLYSNYLSKKGRLKRHPHGKSLKELLKIASFCLKSL
jgi:hypothetical protein